MEEILAHYNGKLYSRKEIETWDLPRGLKEDLEMDKYEFFFITSSKEKEHGIQKHVHLSLYPTKFNIVHLLEVQLPVILPQVLHLFIIL